MKFFAVELQVLCFKVAMTRIVSQVLIFSHIVSSVKILNCSLNAFESKESNALYLVIQSFWRYLDSVIFNVVQLMFEMNYIFLMLEIY